MGFPKRFSGRRPKLAREPWQTRAVARARSVILALGLARLASRNSFPGDCQSCKAVAAVSRARARPVAAMAVLLTRSGQIARFDRFGLRMADILPRIRILSTARPSHFYQGLAEWKGRPAAVLYQGRPACGRFIRNGRFIKIEGRCPPNLKPVQRGKDQ